MQDTRPEEDEFLQPVDLSADTASPSVKAYKPRAALLLVGLLALWSVGVFLFFTREDDQEQTVSEPIASPTEQATEPVEVSPLPTPTIPPPEKAVLRIESDPPGATVLYQNQFIGTTPLEVSDAAIGESFLFQYSGYEAKRVRLEEKDLSDGLTVSLSALRARVRIKVQPEESRVFLNGETFTVPEGGSVLLALLPQELRVEAPGFIPQTLRFTPAQAYERVIEIRLNPLAPPTPQGGGASELPPQELEVKTTGGLEMLLPDLPMNASLGSLRGTAGRQSNEVQVKVKLSRAFRISKTEITNELYRKFKPEHSSGRWKGVDLNGDHFPVTGVSWEDAVAFCNWLSVQENLPAAYIQKDSGWEFQEKPGTGYRLPTEAEWETLGRFTVKESLFGWGDSMPPASGSVNIAGTESQKLFGMVMEKYSDSFAGPAPVEEAGEGPFGIRGLYGNVREWVQDGYSIPRLTSKGLENPVTSASGKYHVIKGASWKDAGIVDLRIARRRYGNQAEVDLGFRVARYLDVIE